MINFLAGVILGLFLYGIWAILRAASNADDDMGVW